MANRIVLVSYLERKKKFSLPTVKDLSDVDYLKREFLTAFAFKQERAVNLSVSFQSFDKEFDDFVEVEDDDVIPDKTKLKAVVMPVLGDTPVTPVSGSYMECILIEMGNWQSATSRVYYSLSYLQIMLCS